MTRLHQVRIGLLLLLIILFALPYHAQAGQKVTIGLNLPLSGARNDGSQFREGAELLREQINGAGGLKIGDSRYEVEYVYADNGFDPPKAVAATIELITKHNVLGVVGPNAQFECHPRRQYLRVLQDADDIAHLHQSENHRRPALCLPCLLP